MRGLVVDRPIPVYSGDQALRHGVDRGAQDAWALASHQRYFEAEATGFFDVERFPVDTVDRKGVVSHRIADESPRRDTTLEKLAALQPVYGGKTITAGNAPGLNRPAQHFSS